MNGSVLSFRRLVSSLFCQSGRWKSAKRFAISNRWVLNTYLHGTTGKNLGVHRFCVLSGNRSPSEGAASCNRSEEHTSELQSLMRISYAVFCLKKKNTTRHLQT